MILNNRCLNAKKFLIIFPLVGQLGVILIILFFGLRLWGIDLSVPFNYEGDTIWFSVPIKGMIDNGWVYNIPQLSAPFTLSAAAFPSMTHTDWLVMKVISLFAPEFGVVLNVFWLFSILLTAWSATFALSLLGVRVWLAAVIGLIYAFLPFSLLRNVGHISLVYYCVPLLSLLAIWMAQGCNHSRSKLIRLLGYFAAIAQGFDYIYYSFFALLLFVFAGWFGVVRTRSWSPIKEASIAGLIILAIASINLAPSFLSWRTYGKPPDITYKSSAEAEIYGLKIRKMLAPNEENKISFFKQWVQQDKSAAFPNENENTSARLGPMAAVGLLFLLALALGLIRIRDDLYLELIKPIVALSLFVILFATVGGLGAIFNLVFTEFRTYNRFSVFIAFFSLSALALWWQNVYQEASSRLKRLILSAGLVTLVLFSLYDQLLDIRILRDQRPDQEDQTTQLRTLVKQVEALVPPGSSVFQLPITGFPLDGGRERMLAYTHGQAYLASSTLKWSWPSFSQRHRTWQDQIQGLQGSELVKALSLANFRLIWIDRFGYSDNGEKILSSLVAAGAKDILPEASQRFSILDLDDVSARLRQSMGEKEFERWQLDTINAPTVSFGKGFYGLEYNPQGAPFRWSRGESEIEIRNWSNAPRSLSLSFSALSGKNGTLTVLAGNRKFSVAVSAAPVSMTLPLEIGADERLAVIFSIDSGRIDLPPGEIRDLHFQVIDIRLNPAQN